ncbi:TPA: fimbrial protein [Klebsiella aerogenes]|nr:fimbrial protein [Klebsiella aerogenes]
MISGVKILSGGLLLALLSGAALADGGQINIDGDVVASSCSVDNGSKNQDVPLGTFYSSDFPSVGTPTQPVSFDIKLTGCTTGIKGAKVSFTGAQVSGNPDLLALTGAGTSGVASGIGVELLDKNMSPIAINSTTESYPLTAGDNNTLTFNLRYKSTATVVTEGDAAATLFFDMQYQ